MTAKRSKAKAAKGSKMRTPIVPPEKWHKGAEFATEQKAKPTKTRKRKGGEATKPQLGRPSSFSQPIANQFLAKIAMGMSMNRVCKLEGMPHAATVFRWLADERYATFRDSYTRACVERREVRKEMLFDIAYDETMHPQSQKILSDNIKWILAKEEPAKYGDKVQLADADGNKLEPPQFIVQPVATLETLKPKE